MKPSAATTEEPDLLALEKFHSAGPLLELITYFLHHKWEQRGDRFQDAQFGAISNTPIQKQNNKSSGGCSEEFFRTALLVYPYCFPSPVFQVTFIQLSGM